jgi:hypothetical protein
MVQQLPEEYVEYIKRLGIFERIADAFTSLDERLNGLAALIDSRLKETNALLSALIGAGLPAPQPGQPSVFDGRLDALVDYVNKVPVFWGTATAGGSSTLIHDGQSWEDNCWAGYLVTIISGRGAKQTRVVVSNTQNTLYVRSPWSLPPDSSSVYVLRLSRSTGNLNCIATGQKTVTTAGTAEQLATDQEVPEGFAVVIMAKPTNTGRIFLAGSKANAEDSSKRFDGLTASLAVSLAITNLNAVWINSTVNGDGVSWIVESTE